MQIRSGVIYIPFATTQAVNKMNGTANTILERIAKCPQIANKTTVTNETT